MSPGRYVRDLQADGDLKTDRSVGTLVDMNTSEHTDTGARILDGVTELILAGGLPAVTLAAVCRQTGLSKGGLVHHFPSKEALVHAFMERACEQFLANITAAMEPVPPGAGLRAATFVDLFLKDAKAFDPAANPDCAAVMIAIVQGGAASLTQRDLYREFTDMLCDDGLSLGVAETIVAAVDGIWLQSMFDPPKRLLPRARRVRQQLCALIRVEVSGSQIDRDDERTEKLAGQR